MDLSDRTKAKLYDLGMTLCYFKSGEYYKETPYRLTTWGDCFAETVGVFKDLEGALSFIEKLSPEKYWKLAPQNNQRVFD